MWKVVQSYMVSVAIVKWLDIPYVGQNNLTQKAEITTSFSTRSDVLCNQLESDTYS